MKKYREYGMFFVLLVKSEKEKPLHAVYQWNTMRVANQLIKDAT